MRAIVVSFVVHVTLVSAALIATAIAPDVLPIPRRAIAYVQPPPLAKLADIDLPATRQRPRTSSAPSTAPSVTPLQPASIAPAPVIAPDGISAETGREGIAPSGQSAARAVEHGGSGVVDLGAPIVEPPPPVRSPVRLHTGIEPPRKIVDVAPVYPVVARNAHVEGVVIIEATIDEHGGVAAAHVLRSIALLDQAAIDAVTRWRFTPARLNGEAVPVVITVTVRFTLQ
jgi:protein TonB